VFNLIPQSNTSTLFHVSGILTLIAASMPKHLHPKCEAGYVFTPSLRVLRQKEREIDLTKAV
jgi:hypothetical protein